MATLRKFSTFAAITRAVDGVAALSNSVNPTRHRLLHTALYTSSSNSSPKSPCFSPANWLSGHSTTFAAAHGGVFFSASAATLAEEVNPKESNDFLPKDVVLYQYEACPFCNKVKAFLDYYDVPYKIVEVNPISKKEIKWSDYRKVPILMVDSERMVDSSDIIDKMFQKLHPSKSADSVPNGDEVQIWRGWVDDHLVHVLSPNIYRTASEALEAFDYITSHGNFSFTERLVAKYGGAAAMYFVSKKLKKKHNITDERGALYEAAETWVNALKGREFLGGSEPSLADLSVFGILRPIRHLNSGKDMVEHTRIGEWYARMETKMKRSGGIGHSVS